MSRLLRPPDGMDQQLQQSASPARRRRNIDRARCHRRRCHGKFSVWTRCLLLSARPSIDPYTTGPEECDGDCFSAMHEKCREMKSVPMLRCIHLPICQKPNVCEQWEADSCKSSNYDGGTHTTSPSNPVDALGNVDFGRVEQATGCRDSREGGTTTTSPDRLAGALATGLRPVGQAASCRVSRKDENKPSIEHSCSDVPHANGGHHAGCHVSPLSCAGIPGPLYTSQPDWDRLLEDSRHRCYASCRTNCFSESLLGEWLQLLLTRLPWERPRVGHGGKLLPRSTAWLTAPACSCDYRYGGVVVGPHHFEPWFPSSPIRSVERAGFWNAPTVAMPICTWSPRTQWVGMRTTSACPRPLSATP